MKINVSQSKYFIKKNQFNRLQTCSGISNYLYIYIIGNGKRRIYRPEITDGRDIGAGELDDLIS